MASTEETSGESNKTPPSSENNKTEKNDSTEKSTGYECNVRILRISNRYMLLLIR